MAGEKLNAGKRDVSGKPPVRLVVVLTACIIGLLVFGLINAQAVLGNSKADIALLENRVCMMSSGIDKLTQALAKAAERETAIAGILATAKNELTNIKLNVETTGPVLEAAKSEIESLKDALMQTKNELISSQDALQSTREILNNKDAWVSKLEQNIPKATLEKLKQ